MTDAANAPVPRTLDEALEPAWLSGILAPVADGRKVVGVEKVEVLKTMATKARFKVTWSDGGTGAFCLKAFLDVDAESARGRATTITEADFYTDIAPRVTTRVPACIATQLDREGGEGIIIMRDLVAEGARFCTALEPFSVDQVSATLDQLARLHAGAAVLDDQPWIGHRVSDFAKGMMPQAVLQELLDGPRKEGLKPEVLDAGRLLEALKVLADRDARLPHTLVHGDCHAGNVYQTSEGPGLIDWQLLQSGGWALDVAYHLSAVLPVEVAEKEEWRLLDDYLERARGYGCQTPDAETAREQYRAAAVWGYFLWAITRRVDPAIINVFVNRLGNAVTRHESYRLLGV